MGAKERLLGRTASQSASTVTPAVPVVAPAAAPNSAKSRLLNRSAAPAEPVQTPASSQTPAAPVTAAVSEGGASPFEQFLKVVGLLDRPRNAYFTGFNAYDQAVKRGELPQTNKYVPLGALSAALFSKQFWQGAKRGLMGEERYTGADVIKNAFPEFAANNPNAAQWLGAVVDIAGDPLVLVGSAAAKPAGAILQAGADAAIGMPGITRALAQAAPPALNAVGRMIRPYIKFGGPSAVGRFLRQSRAGIASAGREGAEEALALGDNLTPEMEREARRLLERSPSASVRQLMQERAGTPNVAAVDLALDATKPAARRFRPVNMGERRLNEVMQAARTAIIDPETTTITNARQARKHLAEVFGASKEELAAMSDAEAVNLALEAQASRATATPMERFSRAAAERGTTPDALFAEASEAPTNRIRRLGERARMARVAGVAPDAPALAGPVRSDPEEAVRLLMERGVPEPAARAAVRGRMLTNQIVKEAQREGLPLEGRGEYFPRITDTSQTLAEAVTQPKKAAVKLVERLRGMVGGYDPNAQARTLAPDLGVEELARLKETGADIPSFRQDFAIPLAVRNQRAKEAIAAHKSIREGFQRFGQGLSGRTPEQLAQEGLVAVKYVPKNSNQPFQFARSAMPDDPENWVAVPRELVSGLQRFHKQFVDDQGLATIGAIWNSVHRLWKGSVTVLRPAFYVNNGLGGMVNNLLADVTDPSAYVDALKAVSGASGRLQTPNGSISYADAVRMMERTGVIDAGLSRSLLKAPTLAEVTGKKGFIGRAADAGAAVEKFNRASIFFDRLKKGVSAEEAALDTLTAHFDYSDEALTEVERRVREFVPFYIWMKNNAEYQVKKFLEKPQVYGAYVRARERLSEEGRDERPTWQRNSLPTGMRIDGQEIRGTSNDPIADVLDLLERPADKLTSSGTPFLKAPLEQLFNKNLYTGRPVSEFPGDQVPFGTGYTNARLAHLIRSLGGSFASIGEAGSRIATGQGSPKDITALIRFVVPGIQAVDPNARLRENAAKVRERLEQTRKRAREQVQVQVKKAGGR